MMVLLKRCIHCGITYKYVASGGSPGLQQSPKYCDECYGAMMAALKTIPVKWERTWVPIRGLSLETLQKWEQEASKGSMMPNMRRISPGLVDMETGKFQVVRIVKGRDGYEGRTFMYSYWEGSEDEAEFQEQVARNVETGQIEIWKVGRGRGWRPLGHSGPLEVVRVGRKAFKVGPVPGGALPEYGER